MNRTILAVALMGSCFRSAEAPRPVESPLLRSIVHIDTTAGEVTLPVHRGSSQGVPVWYIVTESSDAVDALARGVTWAPRMGVLRGSGAVQRGSESSGELAYAANVDFAPERVVRPQVDSGFPPLEARPGSIARPGYSSFVELPTGVILNAPIIASETGALDRVVSIDSTLGTVRLRMSRGYFNDRHAWYISTEASDPQVAAFERATYAPALARAPAAGASDATSARSGILSIANGIRERGSPERQGMQSALLNDLSPLNILQHAPSRTFSENTYSPLWDLHLMKWTKSAIETNQREKVFSWEDGAALAKRGLLVTATASNGGSELRGLQPAGVAINCPLMITFGREAPR
jgi:hypothetical protein